MQVLTQHHGQPANVASVHGEHEDQFGAYEDAEEEDDEQANARHDRLLQAEAANVGRGGGRGGAPPGRGLAPLGRARRVLHNVDHAANRDDDGLGKPKFSIPKFEGSIDVEEYINWELKMDQLWRLHDYTEDRKIKLASSEFDGYALLWWHGLVNARREANDLPIRSWREMKEEMQHRFVPRNYRRSLYDKLQNLKQGTSSMDEYYKEMELIMQRAKVREEPEQTMQRFLSGLNFNIKRIVRHYQYADIEVFCIKHVKPSYKWPKMPNICLVLPMAGAIFHHELHLVLCLALCQFLMELHLQNQFRLHHLTSLQRHLQLVLQVFRILQLAHMI
jgi:hypothetical protein